MIRPLEIPDRAHELVEWFDEALLIGPGRDFLVRMIAGICRVDEAILSALVALQETLLDGERVPLRALRALATSAGWDAQAIPAVAALTEDQLRSLAIESFRLWRVRSSVTSWRGLVEALVGGWVLVEEWFDLQIKTGWEGQPHLLPVLGALEPGEWRAVQEWVSDIWIEDPLELADLEVIANLLDVFRASNERINLGRALWVDTGRKGPALWEDLDPTGLTTTWTWAPSDAIVSSIGPTALIDGRLFGAQAPDGSHATWADYVVRSTLDLAEATIWLAFDGVDTGYRLTISEAGGSITLHRVISAAATSIASQTGLRWASGVFAAWRFEFLTDSTGSTVRVYLAGDLLLEYRDTSGSRIVGGAFAWRASALSTARARGVIIAPSPPDRVRIGPSV